MTLKSPLQDLRETTLAAISGRLARLAYLGSLRGEGGYRHWGMSMLHGKEASDRALRMAHGQALSAVLRAPIAHLEEDLRAASGAREEGEGAYLEGIQRQLGDLLPSPEDSVSAIHLKSVLIALS